MAKTTTSTPQDSGSGSRLARARAAASSAGTRSAASDPATRRAKAPNLVGFFQESRAELRKVTWPTRQETMNLTTAVIGMTVAVAVFLGLMDAGLDKLVSILLGGG